MSLVFNVKDYQGPLDLLLQLIGNAKIDIKDIFVSEVTDQYIQIVQNADSMDMEEASEFIQMAATLLLIKSRSILPVIQTEEDEEDPETTLIRQLEEYAKFQQLALQMQDFELAASRLFSKLPDEFPLPPPVYELEGLTLEGLIEAFAKLSARLLERDELAPEKHKIIRKDQHSVTTFMKNIMQKTRKGSVGFAGLLSKSPSRNEVVTLFLALLELLKQGRLKVVQESSDAEILLMRNRREVKISAE
ncbi:MAG: segregation/condensation protein A [Clostridiales bacterium]|nr:segregation/condensation protein A [Clostridiales bacterium]